MKKLDGGTNYARFALGDLTVIALRDGYVDMPASRLRQTSGLAYGADLPPQVDLVGGHLRLSVNAFLIIDHGEHILIDTGAANAWLPTMGLLLDALHEAGVARGSIPTVAFTHTHEDHVNGLVAADGSDAFPGLRRLLVPQEEVSMFDAYDRLAGFRNRRLAFGDGFRISESVTALQAHGHEVGHTVFEVSSQGESLLVWGDIVHVPSIQFEQPDIVWELDADPSEARSTRQRILRLVARPNVFAAGAHLDFPGVGSVVAAGEAYRYTPL